MFVGKLKTKSKISIIITSRDEEILKRLYVEPHTRFQIREKYFKCGEKYASNAAVSRRLRKLLINNYIIEEMTDGKLCFCLGESGANYLQSKLGYKIDHLTFDQPKGFLIRKRKDTGYKRLVLTSRDLDVCEALARGPAIFETLAKYFVKDDGTPCSRPFVTRRLQKLEYFGFIKRVDYKFSNPSIVFYIDAIGAEELMLRRNYDSDQIRMTIVKREELLHEFLITKIVWLIHNELDELKYRIRFIYDDHYLRKKMGNKKNTHIPDLYLGIETEDGKKYLFCVEVDTGKRPAWTLSEKIEYYRGKDIKIITINHKRMEIIKREIMNTVDINIIKRTEIGVLSDIAKEGFFYRRGWTYLGDLLQKDSAEKPS